MATRREGISAPDLMENVFMKVRKRIEVIFDSLIEKVNERRETFMRQLNEWEEEFNRTRTNHNQSLEKIKKERNEMEELFSKLTIATARSAMEKRILELSEEINEKEKQIEYPRLRFICDNTNDLELNFSQFGFLIKENVDVVVRNYTEISEPVKVFGRFGKGKGEFSGSRGVAIDDKSKRIFIVDSWNSRIQVWSLEGNYLSEFGGQVLPNPWGITLCGNFIYISEVTKNFLSKWSLRTLTLETKSETSKGSEPGQLNWPSGLDTDGGEIFVVEYRNKRISVFDLDLKFKRTLANNALDPSHCLQVKNNVIYIADLTGTIKIFSKTDQLLKTIQKHPSFSSLIYHFTFGSQLNFLVTDRYYDSLYIISPSGDLIHSVRFTEFGLHEPAGIAVSKDGRLVLSFQSGSNAVAIF